MYFSIIYAYICLYIYEVRLKSVPCFKKSSCLYNNWIQRILIHFRYKIFHPVFLAFPILYQWHWRLDIVNIWLSWLSIALFHCLYFCVLFKIFGLYQVCKDFLLYFLQDVLDFYLSLWSNLRCFWLICCFVVREDHGSVFLFVFLAILCKFRSFLSNNFIFCLKQFEWILLSSAKKTAPYIWFIEKSKEEREKDKVARSEPLFRCFEFILKDREPVKTRSDMVIFTL